MHFFVDRIDLRYYRGANLAPLLGLVAPSPGVGASCAPRSSLESLAKIIIATKDLYLAVGPVIFIVLVVLGTAFAVFAKVWQDRTLRKGYDEALDAKEETIQRLADDNLAWRRYFMREGGMSDEQIARLETPAENRRTLSTPAPRSNAAVRRASKGGR